MNGQISYAPAIRLDIRVGNNKNLASFFSCQCFNFFYKLNARVCLASYINSFDKNKTLVEIAKKRQAMCDKFPIAKSLNA